VGCGLWVVGKVVSYEGEDAVGEIGESRKKSQIPNPKSQQGRAWDKIKYIVWIF